MALKRRGRWPVEGRLYWCPSCGAPLLQPRCSRCGVEAEGPLRLTPPGDYRPAMPGDYSRIRVALESELGEAGVEVYRRVFEGSLLVVNRVPHLDEMREVLGGGGHLGKYYFDPVELRWRFRLGKYTARVAVELGAVPVIRLKPGEPLEPIIVVGEGRWSEGQQVVIADYEGEPIAIGYYWGDAVHVQTRLGGEVEPRGELLRVKLTTDELWEANREAMDRLVGRAMVLIDQQLSRARSSGRSVVVSFSGGKDSHVTLDLVVRCGGDPELLFNDTGLEFPETISTVEEAARSYGLKLVVASAGDAFWRSLEHFGPPARDYRWCCKVCKLAPTARLARERYSRGAINFVGQRAFESLDRARTPRLWRNRWFPWILNATPIQDWVQYAIWLYAWRRRLKVNPLYSEGVERIGCYLCPASAVAEYQWIARRHPEMWSKWIEKLEEWRRRLGHPEEWLTRHLWRWLKPHPHRDRIAEKLGVKLPPHEEVLRRLARPTVLEAEVEVS